MATVVPMGVKHKTRNQFCHLYSHMVPMPHSESNANLKQLRNIRNKIYNGYSEAPGGQTQKWEPFLSSVWSYASNAKF